MVLYNRIFSQWHPFLVKYTVFVIVTYLVIFYYFKSIFIFLIIIVFYFYYYGVGKCIWAQVPMEDPRARIARGCKLPDIVPKSNSSPLEEHRMFLTTSHFSSIYIQFCALLLHTSISIYPFSSIIKAPLNKHRPPYPTVPSWIVVSLYAQLVKVLVCEPFFYYPRTPHSLHWVWNTNQVVFEVAFWQFPKVNRLFWYSQATLRHKVLDRVLLGLFTFDVHSSKR